MPRLLNVTQRVLDAVHRSRHRRKKALTGIGERYPAVRAFEQGRPERFLELSDLMAYRSLGDAQICGRLGEAAMPCGSFEGP